MASTPLFPALAVLLAGMAGLAAGSVEAAPLSLKEAVTEALAHNPELLRRREIVREARETRREVTAEALPEVTFEFTASRFRNPGILNSPNFQDIDDQEPLRLDLDGDGTPEELSFFGSDFLEPVPVDSYIYTLELTQPLFTWGRVPSARAAARRALDGVKLDVLEAERDVALQVTEAFYGLQLARRQVSVLEAERVSRGAQVQRSRDRLSVGAGTRLDVLRAEVELANLEPRLLQARTAETRARARLGEALGRNVSEGLEIAEPDLSVLEVRPPDLDVLLGVAELRRPALRRFAVDRYLLDAQVRIERSELRPQVDFTGAYGSDTIDFGNLGDRDFSAWRVGVTASWTLFDGRRTPSRIRQIVSRISQSEHEESAFRLSMTRELRVTLGEWRQAEAALRASQGAVEQATEAKRVAEESYVWGAATSLDALDAERALREAELSLLQAAHDQALALARVKYLSGLRAHEPLPPLTVPLTPLELPPDPETRPPRRPENSP